MATKEKRGSEMQVGEQTGGKILTAALYIATVFFILGFFWQSIASFVLPE
jgi:hypothetical protein